MNKAFLIGNLTHDPDSNTAQNGVTYCRFSIAVSRRFKKDETDFLNIVSFGKTAENCAKYLSKGSKVAVLGSIQTGSYEKDGQRRYTTDIVADEVQFLNSKNSNASYDVNPGKLTEPPKKPAHISEMKPVDEDLPF